MNLRLSKTEAGRQLNPAFLTRSNGGTLKLIAIISLFCLLANCCIFGQAQAKFAASSTNNTNSFSTKAINPPTNLGGSNLVALVTITWTASASGSQYNVYYRNNGASNSCPSTISSYTIFSGMPVTATSYGDIRSFSVTTFYCYMVQTVSGTWTSVVNPTVAIRGLLSLGLKAAKQPGETNSPESAQTGPVTAPAATPTPAETPATSTPEGGTATPEPSVSPKPSAPADPAASPTPAQTVTATPAPTTPVEQPAATTAAPTTPPAQTTMAVATTPSATTTVAATPCVTTEVIATPCATTPVAMTAGK